jgi:sodium/bile acid cotransporter 7
MSEKRKWSPLILLKSFGLEPFVLALVGMIGLAAIFPKPGLGNGPFSLKEITNYGVSLVFFFYGLKLNRSKLLADLKNWKLHTLIHFSTFVIFPLVILAIKHFADPGGQSMLWLGIFFLSTLPSTVSSSVVMVSIAEGNIAGAIFNASISSILGIFLTPLWMQLANTSNQSSADFNSIIYKLLLQILLPVIVGILLNNKWGKLAEKYKKGLRYFDQLTILLIVYTAFCESFAEHVFAQLSLADLVLLGIGMLALFFFSYFLITAISKALGFNREDRITAVFCGSKKSLVHGTVMSKVLFPASGAVGLLLLPLMMYHALQLIAASIIANKMQKEHQATLLKSDH